LASGSQDNYIRVWRISMRNEIFDEVDTLADELRLKEDSFIIAFQGPFFSFLSDF